ncbi:cadherin-like protein 26 [Anguilla rostrata]|uniref:cadherin-like protein 26 n=1 Tax=Anguilla rostrata TaxID=7938 RepID=UPI0030D17C03
MFWITFGRMSLVYTMKAILMILLVTLHVDILGAISSKEHIREKRAWIIDSFIIEEEHPGPFPYVLGNVKVERDYQVGFSLHGKGVDEEPKGILSIDKETGVIYVNGKVDYEQHQKLKLIFEAKNMSNMVVDTVLGVEVTISDINDHAPEFQMELYKTSLEESTSQGQHVIVVLATDKDARNSPNSTFDYNIVSVDPQTPNVEFYIKTNGAISFKGCLDYEKATKYTILVEAKDRGEVIRLSSTCTVLVDIIDKNNHLPTVIGRTGTGRVQEGKSGQEVLRLQAEDRDAENTPAWRVKYRINGDNRNYFKIETDPETNEGVLSVQKPLDFEEGPERNLFISLENEDPYFSCVVKRKTKTELWQVVTADGTSGTGLIPEPVTEKVIIVVEDINDPPVFTHKVKSVMVEEDVPVGQLLEQFTAVDMDLSFNNEFEYSKGDDPDNWVTVDPKTGQISTAKLLDRESPYVVNNTYTVTLYAISHGETPMTATATLTIHVEDKNDNLPHLLSEMLDMCMSDGPTFASLTAIDSDEPPYSGPFRFELLGDVKNKWHLDPNYGTTINLVKANTVYAGEHKLMLKIYDTQGAFFIQNLAVTVCECSVVPNCQVRSATSTQLGGSAVGIMICALLLLMGLVFLVFLISCRSKKSAIQIDQGSGEYLIPSNIETPGTDCKIPSTLLQVDKEKMESNHILSLETEPVQMAQQTMLQSSFQGLSSFSQSARPTQQFQRGSFMYRSLPMQSQSRSSQYQGSTFQRSYSISRGDSLLMQNEALNSLLGQRIFSIQTPGQELFHYEPRVYTYEEDLVTDPQLDAISIPESEFAPDKLLELGPQFNYLATICNSTPPAH